MKIGSVKRHSKFLKVISIILIQPETNL
jgi:hypothetical protein